MLRQLLASCTEHHILFLYFFFLYPDFAASQQWLLFTERQMNGCSLSYSLSLLSSSSFDSRDWKQKKRCLLFLFSLSSTPPRSFFYVVEIWIPLGWCWCELLSPRRQTPEIKPRHALAGAVNVGSTPVPFSLNISLFFICFCLCLSFLLFSFRPQLWSSFLLLSPPRRVSFSGGRQACLREKATAEWTASFLFIFFNQYFCCPVVQQRAEARLGCLHVCLCALTHTLDVVDTILRKWRHTPQQVRRHAFQLYNFVPCAVQYATYIN